jgi:hypothetical protein
MTNKTGLTHEQLMDEFVKAATQPTVLNEDERREPSTWTAPEIQADFEISRRKARAIVKELSNRGILMPDQVWRIDDWGVKGRVRGYRLCNDYLNKTDGGS